MWILVAAGALAAGLAAQESVVVQAPANVFPPRDPPLVDMPRRVFALTGADPVDCGAYPLRQVNDALQGATRDQLRAALRCAERAIKDRRPFWTYNERRGIDSWVAHGLLRTSSGELRSFVYDGSPCGGPGCEPRLSVQPCREPSVRPAADGAGPDFSCREW
jgi:hypothetical protein